ALAAHRRAGGAARPPGHDLARARGRRRARPRRGAARGWAADGVRRMAARPALMPWWYAVVESRHELQNPTSPENIRRLGELRGLDGSSRVLDVAGGKGGPAVLLASELGCRITLVELSAEFAAVARERAAGAGVAGLVEVVESDAKKFAIEPGGYDAALC